MSLNSVLPLRASRAGRSRMGRASPGTYYPRQSNSGRETGDSMSRTVIGVFGSKERAERTVNELRDYGIGRDEISIVTRDEARENRRGDGEGRGRGGGGGSYDLADVNYGGQDVGSGVAWGGGLGGLAGLLAGAGALAVPGIGPVLAAGPLAAVLSGAVTGGIAGGLVDYGVPEERGREYERRIRKGDVLLVVRAEDDRADRVSDIMRGNGGEDVEVHRSR